MATELFSLWGGQTGWLSQAGKNYDVSAMLKNGESYYFLSTSREACEKAFYRAARRAFFAAVLIRLGLRRKPPRT